MGDVFKLVLEMGQKEEEKEVELPCPKCGEETESDDKFCKACGTALPVARPTAAQFSKARSDAMKKMLMEGED